MPRGFLLLSLTFLAWTGTAMLRGIGTVESLLQEMATGGATATGAATRQSSSSPSNVLIVWSSDGTDDIEQLAKNIGDGATSVGSNVRIREVSGANYKRDVAEWADAVVVGSGVFNGNPSPNILDFINSFDFEDRHTTKVAGAFATGGAAAGGLEHVLAAINRALKTFGFVSVGGSRWQNADGTGLVTGRAACDEETARTLSLARDQGARTADMAFLLNPRPLVLIGVEAPSAGVSQVLNSVAASLGKARWSNATKLTSTCESYCRGWSAAAGCGICLPSAFSIPPGAGGDRMCVHPGPLGNGLLCRVDQASGLVTGESCCGVGGPCELPTASDPGAEEGGLWPGACCAPSASTGGHANCGACAGGSPPSDRFPWLNDTRTLMANRRYYDYETGNCEVGDLAKAA